MRRQAELRDNGAFAFGSQDGLGVLGVLMLLGGIVGFTVASWLLSTRVLPDVIVFLKRALNRSTTTQGQG